ncbi:serine hydrolase domain-containing protein [Actinomyces capricornis]|uniref:Beta-lactamase-related domain-containing protein n=1 Tax=Actinomyces capricornis TaxID=2755559 RepID=A0ABN6K5L3_9ACTO|nr:serine hydrolase domain-containing protein [Actinomyces capricornis]BDA63354.1 hypothetical protein MANAM107_01880 [Actinomyces capricornis]
MSSDPDSHRSFQHWCETSLHSALVKATARRRGLPPPQVLVAAPGVRFSFGAIDQPFHTASIGKTFVAALTARLAHKGLLTLDSPVGDLAPGLDLRTLPAAPGVNLHRDVTVAHLLSHRSGLPDPLMPPRRHSTECSLSRFIDAPDRHWSPAQVLEQTAGLPPTGRPGERFSYSDANYALILCTLERIAAAPFTELLSRHVFKPAGMERTGQPHTTATDEELGRLDIAPMWIGGHEVSRMRALTVGSADGGAVSTAEDLARFQVALHEKGLVDAPHLARMARPLSRLRPGIHYGTGLATIRFSEFMPLILRGLPEPVGGIGLSAAHCFYYPRQRTHVVMNFHSTAQMRRSFAVHLSIARRLARQQG